MNPIKSREAVTEAKTHRNTNFIVFEHYSKHTGTEANNATIMKCKAGFMKSAQRLWAVKPPHMLIADYLFNSRSYEQLCLSG